jgi:hypothetical protein
MSISSAVSFRRIDPGSTFSMNTFRSKMSFSPTPAVRKPRKTSRAFSGHSPQVSGLTIASMKAMAETRSEWRLAQ